jgi:hypothetical protein
VSVVGETCGGLQGAPVPAMGLDDVGISSFTAPTARARPTASGIDTANMAEASEAAGISYEELAELEKEFDDVELDISEFVPRLSLSAPLFSKQPQNSLITLSPHSYPPKRTTLRQTQRPDLPPPQLLASGA